MAVKKPRIVIIGAGMAGLTAANKLYTATSSKDLFELCVVEGGTRIGGRINTSEFGGDRIEMGATWIHGIGGSPIHKIAQEIQSLHSDMPWECMDGNSDDSAITIAEGGFMLQPSIVDPVTKLFKHLMDYSQGKRKLTHHHDSAKSELESRSYYYNLAAKAFTMSVNKDIDSGCESLSVGSFLRKGLDAYWGEDKEHEYEDGKLKGYGNWSRKSLEEAVFAMHENTQRTYTSAGDLLSLDYRAESEYIMFPGEEVTIAKGYLSIIEHLASVLPPGLVQLGKKVTKIEWKPQSTVENGGGCCLCCSRPVKLHFSDGSVMSADHVIVTVSLGVLKAAIRDSDDGGGDGDSGMFCPPLPSYKAEAISRLGFGVVNKLFVQLSQTNEHSNNKGFPFLQMAFHSPQSELRHKKIPWWMRRTATLFPIYNNSRVLLSWFAGEEALALESLKDEEILNGVTTAVSSFLSHSQWQNGVGGDFGSHKLCNGNVNSEERSQKNEVKFCRVLKSKWGTDPLFLGSYSYVAVGSSGDDLDTMAEPLPKDNSSNTCHPCASSPLQILFAGEATHRTHYSTTHGAYFSGLREANRLLQHYHSVGIYNN